MAASLSCMSLPAKGMFMKLRNVSPFISRWIAASAISLSCATIVQAQAVPTLDPNFRPVITRLGGSVSAVAVQPDGKLVLAGAFNAINSVARNGLARINPDGAVDL